MAKKRKKLTMRRFKALQRKVIGLEHQHHALAQLLCDVLKDIAPTHTALRARAYNVAGMSEPPPQDCPF